MSINLTDDELVETVKGRHLTDRLVTELTSRFTELLESNDKERTYAHNVDNLSSKIDFDDFLKLFIRRDVGLMHDPRIMLLLTQDSQGYLSSLGEKKIDYTQIVFAEENALTLVTILQVHLARKEKARKQKQFERIRTSLAKKGSKSGSVRT